MAIATEQSKGIGQAVHRKEDKKLLTGKGRYVDDLKLPGMQHMAVVRSTHAHADITGIDTSKAKAMPGVTAVLTGDDLEFAAGVPCASNPTGDMVHPVRPPLAKGRVRHAGEPVAVVIAADRYTAADAAALVEVSYNPLPAVITPEAALADGAPKIHAELDSNVALVLAHKTDGVDEAFANAEVVVKHTIRNQRLIHVPIETRGVVADWNTASDELVVYSSTQVPHFLRTFLAIVCGVSEAKVRAIAPDVGGGFGSKLNAYAEEFIAAAASRKVGAPVKWIEERSEAMLATCHGRAQDATMELAATKDGKVLAMRVHYVQDYGSYLQMLTPLISQLTLLMSPGAYAIPEVDVTVTNVYTNTVPTDALRGAGRPEATHAIERMMDILARELGMSRTEIRRRNFPQEFPFTTAIGLMYDSGDYDKTLDKLLEESDSKDEFEKRRAEAASRGKLLGRGLSTWVEVCGFVPSDVARSVLGLTPGGWESSTVRMHPTGKVTVITGTSPHGQGHATSWSQIIETELGIPFDDVEVIHGDTAFAPYGLGTYGSRSRRRRRDGRPSRGDEAARQGPARGGPDARGIVRRHRILGRHVLGQGQPRQERHDAGGGVPRLAGVQHARGRDAGAGRDGLLRPAELRVPIRRPRLRGRGRQGDGQGRDHGLHRRGRLRQRHQPGDRGRPGARRRRARHRPGALRGRRLRRERAAPHRLARGVRHPVGGRGAADPDRTTR